jgi:cell division transport system permease protein
MIRYVFRQTLHGIIRNPWNHAITTITVCLAVFIFCAFLLVIHNTGQFLGRWQASIEITAYLKKGLPPQEQNKAQRFISEIPGVVEAHLVSEEEALRQFREALGSNQSLLEGLSSNPLPSSVELKVDDSIVRSPEKMNQLLNNIGKIPSVDLVQSGQDWVERMAKLKAGLTVGAFILGGGLLMAVIFIISNTIKLTVYSREEEVEIMRLVGATDGFIRAPFVVEGTLHGLIGTMVALGLLSLGFHSIIPLWNLNFRGLLLGMNISFIPLKWLCGMLATGILVGGLASFVSLARFLQR